MRLLERLRRVSPQQETSVLNTERTGKVVDKMLDDLRRGFLIEETEELEEDEERDNKRFEVVLKGNGRYYKVLESYSIPTSSYISIQEHKSLKYILEDPIAIGKRGIWLRYWLNSHVENGLDFHSARRGINYSSYFGWLNQRSLREILDFFDCVMHSRVDEGATQELFKRRESRYKSDIEKGTMRVR